MSEPATDGTVETVGVLSDVHANAVALEAVLAELEGAVDALVCAGDVVGYGPSPGACLDRLRELSVPCVLGNHDDAVVRGRPYEAGDRYAFETLSEDAVDYLSELPRSRSLFDGRLRLTHNHPAEPDWSVYVYPEEFTPELLGAEPVLVLGHTHVQAAESFPEGVVLNPGSVGQPRDGDPRAAYAVVDLAEPAVQLRRTEYDIDRVATRIEAAGLSPRAADRLAEGR